MAKPLLPDDLWKIVEPELPEQAPKPKGGRPRIPDKDVLVGIIFVLRSRIPWEMLPQEMGCGSVVDRKGIPLAIAQSAANVHDSKVMEAD